MLHIAWNLSFLTEHDAVASLLHEKEASLLCSAVSAALFSFTAFEEGLPDFIPDVEFLSQEPDVFEPWLDAYFSDVDTVADQATYSWPLRFFLDVPVEEDDPCAPEAAFLTQVFMGELLLWDLSPLTLDWQRGTSALATQVSLPLLNELILSLDPWFLLLELTCALFFALAVVRARSVFWLAQPFYDDLVLFCKARNISITEVFTLLTFSLGYIVFDAVLAVTEDDIFDNVGYGLFACMGATILLIIVAVDLQYFALISGASNGELSLRLIYSDFLNNVLCLMRVFSCWIRYLFYDLQAEAVDLVFHYADSADPLSSLSSQETLGSAFGASQGLLWSLVAQIAFLGFMVSLDVIFWLIQLLVGCLKLALALYLFWLVVDLLLLRSLAHAESLGLVKKRAWRRLPL